MEKTLNQDAIQQKCDEFGLSQSSIASQLGVTRAAVSKWFKDQSFPRPAELMKLGRLLNLKHNELTSASLMVKEPLVAFRKRGTGVTTKKHIERAKDMGYLLRPLVEYLDFDPFLGPASLKNPSTNYRYMQELVAKIRRDLNVSEDAPIEFEDLIGMFHDYQAVIIPTLWGEKSKHENALHIHLPDSKTTWIYLNLDVQIHDFKFWMAHELGHVLTIDLLENNKLEKAENFADTFAGTLLFPEGAAEKAYDSYSNRRSESGRLNALCEYAKKYAISPYSVYLEIEKYAKEHDKTFTEVPPYSLHQRRTQFSKGYKLLSAAFFDDKTPSADHFMRVAQESFGTNIYKALGSYIKEKGPSSSLVASLLSVSPMDGRAYCEALAQ